MIDVHRVFAKRIVKFNVRFEELELAVTSQECFLFLKVKFRVIDKIDNYFLHVDLFESRILGLVSKFEDFCMLSVHILDPKHVFVAHSLLALLSVETINCLRIQSLIAVINLGPGAMKVTLLSNCLD